MSPTSIDQIHELERILKEQNYKSKEPFAIGENIVIFQSGKFYPAVFTGYRKCNFSLKEPDCPSCFGNIQFKSASHSPLLSGCSTADWGGSRRRIFLASDPIVELLLIHYNY